jgi:hypothetical protein
MAESDVRFKIGDKTYDTGAVDQISLRDVVLFNRQSADMGLGVTWADVERIAGEMAGMTEKDAAHPEALVMFAVTVWAARRIAGDDVTLEEAVDVPMASIEILEARKAPKDHQPKKARRPAAGDRVTSLASAPSDPTTPQTSTEQSESA